MLNGNLLESFDRVTALMDSIEGGADPWGDLESEVRGILTSLQRDTDKNLSGPAIQELVAAVPNIEKRRLHFARPRIEKARRRLAQG